MNTEDFEIIRLDTEIAVAAFDCGDEDLNGFIANDAADYQREKFATTHLLVTNNKMQTQIAGYFCLLTDKIVFDPSDEEQRKDWKAFNKQNKIHFKKHRKNYPSIKIGRLAISLNFAGQGLGRFLIMRIVYLINNLIDVGCRFITVDAYNSAFDFYLKNGFSFLTQEDEGDETRVMYLDIKRFTL